MSRIMLVLLFCFVASIISKRNACRLTAKYIWSSRSLCCRCLELCVICLLSVGVDANTFYRLLKCFDSRIY